MNDKLKRGMGPQDIEHSLIACRVGGFAIGDQVLVGMEEKDRIQPAQGLIHIDLYLDGVRRARIPGKIGVVCDHFIYPIGRDVIG